MVHIRLADLTSTAVLVTLLSAAPLTQARDPGLKESLQVGWRITSEADHDSFQVKIIVDPAVRLYAFPRSGLRIRDTDAVSVSMPSPKTTRFNDGSTGNVYAGVVNIKVKYPKGSLYCGRSIAASLNVAGCTEVYCFPTESIAVNAASGLC